jgi:acetolactate synthase-1/2/3 large subunit
MKSINLPEECIIIPDCGGNLVWAMQSLALGPKQRLFTNFGNSSMGYALPASIGASIATDKRIPIICICGDGGIQMNVQEFQTMSSLALPINVLIINNSGYGIIRQFQDQYFGSRYTATSTEEVFGENGVDIVKIARAYGLDAIASTRVEIYNKPYVYDVQIDATQKIYPKLEFGNALENMTPLMPEIESLMIVPYVQPNVGKGWVTK